MIGSILRKTFHSVNAIAFLPLQIQTQSLNLSYLRVARQKVSSAFLLASVSQQTCAGILVLNSSTSSTQPRHGCRDFRKA